MLLREPGNPLSESERPKHRPSRGRRPAADARLASGAHPSPSSRSGAAGRRTARMALGPGAAARYLADAGVAADVSRSGRLARHAAAGRLALAVVEPGGAGCARLAGSCRPRSPGALQLVAAPGSWRRSRGGVAVAPDPRPAGFFGLGAIR